VGGGGKGAAGPMIRATGAARKMRQRAEC
jgi:hypothetical protein